MVRVRVRARLEFRVRLRIRARARVRVRVRVRMIHAHGGLEELVACMYVQHGDARLDALVHVVGHLLGRAGQRRVVLPRVDVARRRQRDYQLAVIPRELRRSTVRPVVPLALTDVLAPRHGDGSRVGHSAARGEGPRRGAEAGGEAAE